MLDRRTKFDTLFADPRYFRGDCRLMRTAIRQGWLDDVPQADRDALMRRFEEAFYKLDEMKFVSDGVKNRAVLALAQTALTTNASNLRVIFTLRRYTWAGKWTGKETGRPRVRLHVDDYPDRLTLDANALRRQQVDRGEDISQDHQLTFCYLDRQGQRQGSAQIHIEATPHRLYGYRWWLRCPICGSRRVKLYTRSRRTACRRCLKMQYARRRW